MKRTLIACPNLSLDRTIRVEHAALGWVHRSIESDVRGGGKGVNVARALKCMGRDALVVGFAAGRTGHAVLRLLEDEGLDTVETAATGETRSCLTVLSETPPTVFNESGPPIDADVWGRYESTVTQCLDGAGIFAFSGSLPPERRRSLQPARSTGRAPPAASRYATPRARISSLLWRPDPTSSNRTCPKRSPFWERRTVSSAWTFP